MSAPDWRTFTTGNMTTSLDIHTQLSQTLETLRALENGISDLIDLSPDVFEDPEIARTLDQLKIAHEEATRRLENPTLNIATFGTTSSGKSTVVNALTGRRIAPIEAGEMSGGILILKHSDERKLIIKETPDADWETGEWTDLSDDEFYNRIQGVMRQYHETRKKKDCIAPQVEVSAPLFPAAELSLSGLPEGIGIEFVDLPGLKSVQDRANLAVIQPVVGKAFSLVALDYMQVDEEHRQKLLEELKKVVENWNGRTDSMIFILNRVDNRGSDDLPLEERVEQLRQEIQQVLGLSELPDVIPFNARLLYYTQCAWGTTALKTPSTVPNAIRLKLLQLLFEDCASVIKQNTSGDKDVKNWFREIEDNLEEGLIPDDYKMRRIMFYSLKWSGGEALWSCIKQRLQDSFSELVIMPATIDVLTNFNPLIDSLNTLIEIRKIENDEEEVKNTRDNIVDFREEFDRESQKSVENVKKDLVEVIKKYIQALEDDDIKRINRLQKYARSKGWQGLLVIFTIIAKVVADLTNFIISPVRDALENNQSTSDLKEKLEDVLTPALAGDVTKAYDNVSRRLNNFSTKSEFLYRKVRADDDKEKKQLEHDEKYVRLLYHTIRQAMTARAELILQTKAKEFEDSLQSVINKQINELIEKLQSVLSKQELSSIDLETATLSKLRQKLTQIPPTLPENFFDFSASIKQDKKTQSEKVGREKYTVGSCFKQEKTRDIYDRVEYVELSLPTPQLMADQWSDGIGQQEGKIWDIVLDWIANYLNDATSLFEQSVIEIADFADRALDERQKRSESSEKQKHIWENFKNQNNHLKEIATRLEEHLKSC